MTTQSFRPENTLSSYLPLEFQAPEKFEEFRDLLAKRERLTASIVNIKENGTYEKVELLTAQQWFSVEPASLPRKTRYSYRKVFDLVLFNAGPIGVATTVSMPHGITGITVPTRIFGTATTSTGKYLPLPYVGVAVPTDSIEIYADATTINIVTGATINGGGNTLTQVYITFEYLKQ